MNAINELTQSGAYATAERMSMAARMVRATNSHAEQMHTVIDREMVGHNLQPGQSEEFMMTVQDIERFQELDKKGHPVKIVQLPGGHAPEPPKQENVNKK